jgi:hypothetical protein
MYITYLANPTWDNPNSLLSDAAGAQETTTSTCAQRNKASCICSLACLQHVGCLAKSNRGGFWLGFPFHFFICCVDAAKVGLQEFPVHLEQMCPEMVENILEPALTCKCREPFSSW